MHRAMTRFVKSVLVISAITVPVMPYARGLGHHNFQLYGHRGARGLVPENTLPAYARAIEIGVDAVDMDVVMTRDGVVVLHHDLALNPDIDRDRIGQWVNETRYINQMTLAELQEYDVGRLRPGTPYAALFPDQTPIDGTRVPTLEQAIDFIKAHGGKHIRFQIEIKDDPENPEQAFSPRESALAVAEVLRKKNIVARTEVQAFNWQCLLELQKIDSRIKTAYLTDRHSEARMRDPDPAIAGKWTGGHLLTDYDNSTAKMIKSLGGTLWDPEDVEVTKDKLDAAHRAGLRMVIWSDPTASGKEVDLDQTEKLVKMGVDGIITDRPDQVIQFRGPKTG